MGLQHVITVTVVIAVLEAMLWSFYYTYYNYTGLTIIGVNWIGAFLGALKLTSLRTMLLLVSIGYSITRPTLSTPVVIGTAILTAFYFFTETANEYIFVGKYIGLEIPDLVDYLATAALAAFNIIYVVWIGYSLNVNMAFLRQRNQVEKLSLYKIFAAALLVFVSLSTLCFVLQFAFSVTKYTENLWSFWWVWNAYWQFSYLTLTFVVAFLWRPNSNNRRYAFSAQIPTDEPKPDDAEELSGDVQLKGGGGGETSDEVEKSDDREGFEDQLENLVL